MLRPQAVIFDIGNMLIEWNPERFYDARLGADRRRAMFAAVDLHGMKDRIVAGGLFRETIHETAAAHPAWETKIRWWHDHWTEMASPRIDGSIARLRGLRARGVPVFALTSFGVHSLAYARTQYPFLAEFDRSCVSAQRGVVKPDPQIIAMVEADCGLPPEAPRFADHRADNITAAARRGWRTHQFETWQGWARRLAAAGLLTQEEAGL